MDNSDFSVYSAMQMGEPYSQYKKTILAQVHVILLNPFSREPEGVILSGKPGEPSSLVTLWTIEEDAFFKKMNSRHIAEGTVIPVKVVQRIEEKTLEQASDEEIEEYVKKPFGSLKTILNNTTSEIFVTRMLEIALKAERSEKIVNAIKTRLAEITTMTFTQESE